MGWEIISSCLGWREMSKNDFKDVAFMIGCVKLATLLL